MSGVAAFFQTHVVWGVPILFLLGFLKSLAIVSLVVPETLMVAGIGALLGLAGGQAVPLFVAIFVGSALGDWASYAIGFRLKERAHHLWPFTRRPDLLPRAEAFFHRWGVLSVVLCRFFSPLRATVPLMCGIFEMAFWPFQIANWVSAAMWAGILVAVGAGLGFGVGHWLG
jgi:membrane protein DedA with SNARE-associated domain